AAVVMAPHDPGPVGWVDRDRNAAAPRAALGRRCARAHRAPWPGQLRSARRRAGGARRAQARRPGRHEQGGGGRPDREVHPPGVRLAGRRRERARACRTRIARRVARGALCAAARRLLGAPARAGLPRWRRGAEMGVSARWLVIAALLAAAPASAPGRASAPGPATQLTSAPAAASADVPPASKRAQFRQASELARAGDTPGAIAIYHDLAASGYESAALYWNWAQAASARGGVGEALWALLRARQL